MTGGRSILPGPFQRTVARVLARKKAARIDFEAFDGQTQARICHGKDCVALLLDQAGEGRRMGIVLTPGEARALGRGLEQQARYSEIAE